MCEYVCVCVEREDSGKNVLIYQNEIPLDAFILWINIS